MDLKEKLPEMKGHWLGQVFEGDVKRKILTSEQIAENKVWERICKETGDVYLPLHIGEIADKPIHEFEGENLVTTNGKGLLLDRLFALGVPPTQVNSMGVGTVATAAAVGDTQLNSGGGGSAFLKAFDALPTRSGLVVTAITTYATTEANFNWQELGLFNGTTNGTSIIFNRIAPIGAFNKTSAVSIVVTVTVTQS